MIVKLLNFYAEDGAVHIGASDGEKTVDVSAVGYSWGWQEIFADWEKIRPQIESVLQHAKPLAHGLRFAPGQDPLRRAELREPPCGGSLWSAQISGALQQVQQRAQRFRRRGAPAHGREGA